MADFKELLAQVENPELKEKLQAEYDTANRLKGEYGNKLHTKDEEIAALKETQKSYSKAAETLKRLNVNADEIPKILEKLNFTKTMEEEYELTKAALKEKEKNESNLEKEIKKFKAEKAVKSHFEKARAELKDENKQPIKIAEKFIDYDKLYDINDFSNEAVLQDKIKTVLTEALTVQTEVLGQIGFQGAKIATTPDGTQKNTGEALNLKEIMEKHGAPYAIEAMRLAAAKQ